MEVDGLSEALKRFKGEVEKAGFARSIARNSAFVEHGTRRRKHRSPAGGGGTRGTDDIRVGADEERLPCSRRLQFTSPPGGE